MKHAAKCLALLLCLTLLTACSPADPETTEPSASTIPSESTEPSASTMPSESTEPSASTMPSESTEPSASTIPSESTAPDGSYLQRVDFAGQLIFDGPGYDYSYLGTVREAGVYTIVEEAEDPDGNLWGRLKSGAGWIDLTSIRTEEYLSAPITVSYTQDITPGSLEYLYRGEKSEFAVQITFQPNEPITDVTFHLLEFTETSYTPGEPLLTLPPLNPGSAFTAEVVFYGDMTAYGLSFTDASGAQRHFAVAISGRNSTLVLWEYVPA